MSALGKVFVSANYNEAYEILSYIQLFQEQAGAAVYPKNKLLAAELFYNELNLGNRLFGFFWILGTVMLAPFWEGYGQMKAGDVTRPGVLKKPGRSFLSWSMLLCCI